jgi:hypothetical protein
LDELGAKPPPSAEADLVKAFTKAEITINFAWSDLHARINGIQKPYENAFSPARGGVNGLGGGVSAEGNRFNAENIILGCSSRPGMKGWNVLQKQRLEDTVRNGANIPVSKWWMARPLYAGLNFLGNPGGAAPKWGNGVIVVKKEVVRNYARLLPQDSLIMFKDGYDLKAKADIEKIMQDEHLPAPLSDPVHVVKQLPKYWNGFGKDISLEALALKARHSIAGTGPDLQSLTDDNQNFKADTAWSDYVEVMLQVGELNPASDIAEFRLPKVPAVTDDELTHMDYVVHQIWEAIGGFERTVIKKDHNNLEWWSWLPKEAVKKRASMTSKGLHLSAPVATSASFTKKWALMADDDFDGEMEVDDFQVVEEDTPGPAGKVVKKKKVVLVKRKKKPVETPP